MASVPVYVAERIAGSGKPADELKPQSATKQVRRSTLRGMLCSSILCMVLCMDTDQPVHPVHLQIVTAGAVSFTMVYEGLEQGAKIVLTGSLCLLATLLSACLLYAHLTVPWPD